MNQLLLNLKDKAYENREVLIKLGCLAVGAVIGAALTKTIINIQTDALIEEMTLSVEE